MNLNEKSKRLIKNILQLILGSIILIMGITLILLWWPCVSMLFKGAIGMVLALSGLMVLFMVKG